MKIVWHCADQVGADMAGPGIRAVELCRRLARRHQVTLVALRGASLEGEPFRALDYSEATVRAALADADAFVAQGFGFPLRSALTFRGRLVLDLYDPVQLEQLARFGPHPGSEERISLAHVRARLRLLLARADHLLCASPAQRFWWLGWLGALGRLTPEALARDPEGRALVAIAPFGTPDVPPVRAGTPLRDAIGAVAGDEVALFWGGLWDWMDPSLAVRALALLSEKRPRLRLAFIAGTRPGPGDMRGAAERARATAVELGVAHRAVFLDRWIPYADRGAWLLDADVAVTAHRPSLETELAFRTRLLDCLWAALPVASTRGDVLAAEAEREGFGACADPGDAEGLARALDSLLEPEGNARAREAARRVARRYRWEASADAVMALLEEPAPRRPPFAVPGEVAGGDALGLTRAVAEKLLARLRR
ncbi:MAG TPA: glycosyltransferase [Anaeromyxobacteraceae bacterium]|nr:glycosyltransferase [Anaeromyxobacteraceae bacterium]